MQVQQVGVSAKTPAPLNRATAVAAWSRSGRRLVNRRAAISCAAAADSVAVASPAGGPQSGGSPAATAQLLALKEWAPTCAAIAAGEQTILLRKGGIKEPTFKPAAREFVLFPTSFHTEAELLKPAARERYEAEVRYDPKADPQLSFGTAAAVTGAWTTHDPAVLEALDGLHVWAPGFLENRLRWRQKQPITVLELRAYRLAAPLVLPAQEDFWGCFSWVDLSSSAADAAALGAALQQQGQLSTLGVAALDDAAFEARQQLCRQQLRQLADLQELTL